MTPLLEVGATYPLTWIVRPIPMPFHRYSYELDFKLEMQVGTFLHGRSATLQDPQRHLKNTHSSS